MINNNLKKLRKKIVENKIDGYLIPKNEATINQISIKR